MTRFEKTRINSLANLFYRLQGCCIDFSYDFSKAHHPQEVMCYEMAKVAHKFYFKNQGEIDEQKENNKKENNLEKN